MSTHETGPAGQAPSHRSSDMTSSTYPDPRYSQSSPSRDSNQNNNRGSNCSPANNSATQDSLDEDEEDQPCQACGSFPARFQCSACQSVRYCSQECQASDWRIHYRECAEITASVRTGDGENDDAHVRVGRDQQHQARSVSTSGMVETKRPIDMEKKGGAMQYAVDKPAEGDVETTHTCHLL